MSGASGIAVISDRLWRLALPFISQTPGPVRGWFAGWLTLSWLIRCDTCKERAVRLRRPAFYRGT